MRGFVLHEVIPTLPRLGDSRPIDRESSRQPPHFLLNLLRRTKASLIYKATGNLRAIQILLGHSKIENTVRYLGVDVDDALSLSEATEICASDFAGRRLCPVGEAPHSSRRVKPRQTKKADIMSRAIRTAIWGEQVCKTSRQTKLSVGYCTAPCIFSTPPLK